MKNKIASFIDLNTNCVKNIKKASFYYHKGSQLYKLIAFIKHRRNRKKYNIEIYPACKIGDIIIPHAVGIVVGRTAQIGNGTTIMPNVVIGAKYTPTKENSKERRHAIIGENCMLGTGCKIIGDITIGNNVTIGANAVITKDIESGVVVVGNNRIIRKVGNENERR